MILVEFALLLVGWVPELIFHFWEPVLGSEKAHAVKFLVSLLQDYVLKPQL